MHNYQACKELTIPLLLLKSSAACECLLEGLISTNSVDPEQTAPGSMLFSTDGLSDYIYSRLLQPNN